jgi:hypothetical protein
MTLFPPPRPYPGQKVARTTQSWACGLGRTLNSALQQKRSFIFRLQIQLFVLFYLMQLNQVWDCRSIPNAWWFWLVFQSPVHISIRIGLLSSLMEPAQLRTILGAAIILPFWTFASEQRNSVPVLVGRRHSLSIFAPVRTIFALIVNLIAHTRNIYAFSSAPVWSLACTMR